MAFRVPSMRMAAASPPGPRTLCPCTTESYCSHTHRLEAMPGEARSFARASPGSTVIAAKVGSSSTTSSIDSGGLMGRAYTGPSSASERAGTSATTSPSTRALTMPPGTTVPITAGGRPHFSHTALTAPRCSGRTTASIRSWDSDVRISNGSIPAWRSGTEPRSMSAPIPARAADSEIAHVIPAPPRS